MSHSQIHLIIHGRVQGVGYRWSMARAAEAAGVRGWVRNRRDGTVEALLAGPSAAVEEMVRWAKAGPAGARVDRVVQSAIQPLRASEPLSEGFEQRETV